MSFKELLTGSGGVLLAVLTLLQVAPVQINPWSWIAGKIGRAVNGEVIEKVDKLGNDVRNLRDECEEREATACRTRILRFGDEILHDVRHSKEHFDQILLDIDVYEKFCESHPDFKNNLAVMAIKHIKEIYAKCSRENSFL